MKINATKILLYGSISYGTSVLDTESVGISYINGLWTVTNDKTYLVHPDYVTYVRLGYAPRNVFVGDVITRIQFWGEVSFENVRLIPEANWSDFGIPTIFTQQIVFIADQRFYISKHVDLTNIEP